MKQPFPAIQTVSTSLGLTVNSILNAAAEHLGLIDAENKRPGIVRSTGFFLL
jgi:hypothetical protein